MASLVIMAAVMMGLLVTMQDLTPVVARWDTRIDSWQNTADKIANIAHGSWVMPMKGEI